MSALLTSGKLWLVVIGLAILAIVGLAIAGKDVPQILNDIVYMLLGAGGGGGAAKLAADSRLAREGRRTLAGEYKPR